jgi:adenine-specific DNA-methyltransferase
MARPRKLKRAETYKHEEEALLRPEVGTQAQFRKRKPPRTYRYDSSLSPALDWDGQNPARERGEALIKQILDASSLEEVQEAATELGRLSRPFLDWAGKAERLSFDVPTLPLFVHERLSTKAILETIKGHARDKQMELQLYADPQLSLSQRLAAYEYPGPWVNRLILGDSLVVMNSLLEYEGLGGQVQMIYIDPPYGVKFGSNFQPFLRKRDVKDSDDESMTREPEMVKAYRDTWELGPHSYLTYLRDRLLIARELLTDSGSVFVQIGDEAAHLVRCVMDEVFGADCHVVTIVVKKKGGQRSGLLDPVNDYLLWYSKTPRADARPGDIKFRAVFMPRDLDSDTLDEFGRVELADGRQFPLTGVLDADGQSVDYRLRPSQLFKDHPGARLFRVYPLTGGGIYRTQAVPYTHRDMTFNPGKGQSWKHSAITDDGSPSGMDRIAAADRLVAGDSTWGFKRYLDDFPFKSVSNWWDGLGGASSPIYVVQTNTEIVKRCMLMTTDPGDLVLDPTCGSGTTAYVAEQWGRRWITVDASRVPLALARQRLLAATFRYFELADPARGPSSGFVYREPRGIVSHTTSSTLANGEPPIQEVIVDRPEVDSKVTRVTGPFVVEATIPTPVESEEESAAGDGGAPEDGSYLDRMLEALRRNPVLQLGGNRTISLRNVRPPAKALMLSAEAALEPDDAPIAILFGPENGAINERAVYDALREAHLRSYEQLLVIGFAIEPGAREFVEKAEMQVGIPATYVQATPDLVMGDLLKTMRSSQIFSVAGLPDLAIRTLPPEEGGEEERYEVELLGLDVFDPVEMAVEHRDGLDVPAWLLDTDYNGMVFHVSQAFFPRTAAWDSLKRSLSGELEDAVWDHLAGTTSAPFTKGESGEIAVKVIDDRGNELLVVKKLVEPS